ncbi:MAG: hypothetical protein NTW86_17850 [Candidatus Sumerlaeota bacterium]|nr:hypothetical protein [Candidatus Sumerlaeota bacterium]
MSDSLERAKQITRRISGFSSYTDPAERRKSEHAFRDYALERLDRFARNIQEVAADTELFAGQPARARIELRLLGDRLSDAADLVRSVPYEYGEFLTASRLDADEAEPFYARDERVLREISAVQSAIEPTLSPRTPLAEFVQTLGREVHSLLAAIHERQAGISGFVRTKPRGV